MPCSCGSRPRQQDADETAAPLNLANAHSLDLLSFDEQSLCSQLRILPKPYLSIKEMYIRENERRHGGLKRRDARYVTATSLSLFPFTYLFQPSSVFNERLPSWVHSVLGQV